jgi:hypothetical protein
MIAEIRPRPQLDVIEGGRDWRADEARVEVLAAFDEQIEDAERLHSMVASLAHDYQDGTRPTDLRWHRAIEFAGRIGARATAARAEYLSLTDGDSIA